MGMQDPAVKQRMQKMLSKLGADSGIDPPLADPAMLDKLFERMQDPEMLEKLEAHTKNESFVARMQELASDPKFSAAATGYVEDMAQGLTEGGGDVSGFGAELDPEDEDEGYDGDDELDEDDEDGEDDEDEA